MAGAALAGPAGAAVAEQDAPGRAVLAGLRCAIGAVADQRASQDGLGGSVDHAQDVLSQGLQGGVCVFCGGV
ncbi:hypothetical protein B1T47_16580 [Mycobacterium kansasii]|nr:hypothetical protein B1T47_16580 [Mycobacterium kansasii]